MKSTLFFSSSFLFSSLKRTRFYKTNIMAAGYRPGSPATRPGSSRPGSPGVHTKVEEDLHTMAGIDYDKVYEQVEIERVYILMIIG
jgi:hypothetical protein